jgi:hypothetical protein
LAVAICQPGEEPVCVGIGCEGSGDLEFVEIIAGSWFEGPTRLSAGSKSSSVMMTADRLASSAMNIPVSRGPVDTEFLKSIVEESDLRIETSTPRYSTTFPLSGFESALEMTPQICAELRRAATMR